MTLAQTKLSDPPALANNNSNDVHARGNLPAALPSPRTPSPPAYVLSWTPNVPWRAIPLPPASAFFGQSIRRTLWISGSLSGHFRPSSPADSLFDKLSSRSSRRCSIKNSRLAAGTTQNHLASPRSLGRVQGSVLGAEKDVAGRRVPRCVFLLFLVGMSGGPRTHLARSTNRVHARERHQRATDSAVLGSPSELKCMYRGPAGCFSDADLLHSSHPTNSSKAC